MITLMDRRRLMFATLNKYLPASEQTIKNLRVTAGGATIGNGKARISEIKGNSLVWNQLVDTSTTSVDTISGRKYYTLIGGTASIVTGDGTPLSVTGRVDMVTDLTLLFGGSVPSGFSVADFQSLFPLPYYSYNAGEIINTTCAKTERVMWNQLVSPISSTTTRGITITNNGDGSLTLSGIAESSGNVNLTELFALVQGHQYFIYIPKNTANIRIINTYWDSWAEGSVNSAIVSSRRTGNEKLGFSATANNNYSGDITINLVDLTLMFGSGNEPTLQECEAIFTEDYYPHDEGTQKTLTLEDGGIESTGFNQWDEEWEVGNLNTSDGSKRDTTDRIRSKNYIQVIPNTEYYFCQSKQSRKCFYDSSFNFISYIDYTIQKSFTTPSNATYMLFCMHTDYGTTYKNDICINISNASLNGTYKSYVAKDTLYTKLTTMKGRLNGTGESVVVFPDGVNGVAGVYDIVTGTSATKKFGVVDLGTIEWQGYGDNKRLLSKWDDIPVKISGVCNYLCDTYSNISVHDWQTKASAGIYIGYVSFIPIARFLFYDDIHTTGDLVNNKAPWLQGVYVLYELATPEEYILDEPIFLGYNAQNGGTENIIPLDAQDRPAVPLIADIRYRKP